MNIAAKYLTLTYLDHVRAYLQHTPIWGKEPSELMRAVEEQAGIPEPGADDFRRSLFAHLGMKVLRDEVFDYDFNPQLNEAIKKLLEQQ